jgi:hypothetical protein
MATLPKVGTLPHNWGDGSPRSPYKQPNQPGQKKTAAKRGSIAGKQIAEHSRKRPHLNIFLQLLFWYYQNIILSWAFFDRESGP